MRADAKPDPIAVKTRELAPHQPRLVAWITEAQHQARLLLDRASRLGNQALLSSTKDNSSSWTTTAQKRASRTVAQGSSPSATAWESDGVGGHLSARRSRCIVAVMGRWEPHAIGWVCGLVVVSSLRYHEQFSAVDGCLHPVDQTMLVVDSAAPPAR